ncbi:MAG: hypothetical protein Q7K57_25180 [Burkholderiaceae bacterium]|nr:hypothetical protein [Burkholderiaceae bacterium]
MSGPIEAGGRARGARQRLIDIRWFRALIEQVRANEWCLAVEVVVSPQRLPACLDLELFNGSQNQKKRADPQRHRRSRYLHRRPSWPECGDCSQSDGKLKLSNSRVFSRLGSLETLRIALVDEYAKRFLAEIISRPEKSPWAGPAQRHDRTLDPENLQRHRQQHGPV